MKTHGGAGRCHKTWTPEYRAWVSMKTRCSTSYKSRPDYAHYAARGIIVCDRWASSFGDFLSDVGAKPSPKHSLDRIDNDGNYEPGNVRWATYGEQSLNRGNNRRVIYLGIEQTLTEAIRAAGSIVCFNLAWARLKSGWSVEDAIQRPPRRHTWRGIAA